MMPPKRKSEEKKSPEASTSKRSRREPERYIAPELPMPKNSRLKILVQELKRWTEGSLTHLSHTLQWDVNSTNEEIANAVEKTPEEVDGLMEVIMKTQWDSVVLKDILGLKDLVLSKPGEGCISEMATMPLDFWRHLCNPLTPPSMNNSSEIAAVLKDIASNSDEEYGPIYEYIAMALDDPLSTFQAMPNMSPVQAGVLLEVIHSLAMTAKEHAHLHDYLCERAISALAGDWAALKMPNRSPADPGTQAKRVALQSLNPFGVSRSSLPPAVCEPLSLSGPQVVEATGTTSQADASPVPSEIRTFSDMAKLKTGYKSVSVPVRGEQAAPFDAPLIFRPYRELSKRTMRSRADIKLEQKRRRPHRVEAEEEEEDEEEEEEDEEEQ